MGAREKACAGSRSSARRKKKEGGGCNHTQVGDRWLDHETAEDGTKEPGKILDVMRGPGWSEAGQALVKEGWVSMLILDVSKCLLSGDVVVKQTMSLHPGRPLILVVKVSPGQPCRYPEPGRRLKA